METTVLLVQAFSLGLIAAWLTTGALENLLHPFLNESYTSEVLDMKRMREDYPDAYAHVAYRRVSSPRLRRELFRLIVVWQLLAMGLAWGGVTALALAAAGLVDIETARIVGLLGACMFTSVWKGFLVAGNWWCYWFGHEGGQNTHFHMTLWGMANIILIAAA